MIDNKCADYAVAFTCGTDPVLAAWWLWQAGRDLEHSGTTDRQIAGAVRRLGRKMRRVQTDARTVRGFVRERRPGRFLITTTDHVVALVDGRLCDVPDYGDLARIEKIHKIST